MKKLLLASTSTIHGETYLQYLLPEIKKFFASSPEIIFIPYARPSGIEYDAYTDVAREAFSTIGIRVKGIHEFETPEEAILHAKGIFTGGGNTFLLVRELYRQNLMQSLEKAVKNGTSYMGTSAGTNIAGLTMQTTNDMPIVYPPSFKTLGFVPFNLNPHYLDPDPNSKHKGETRETRIKEFHKQNNQPVVGLREGSWLLVEGNKVTLKGAPDARIFETEKVPYEIKSESDLSELN